MEKAADMGHFDIFQSAKSVRRSRPELMENVEEYKFCYELVKAQVKHFYIRRRKFEQKAQSPFFQHKNDLLTSRMISLDVQCETVGHK